ncbi:MAG: hypothetical protein ABW155_05970, partial [Candidatus Thiodiazotropha sp.]
EGLKEPIGSVLQTASNGSQLKPPALPGDTYHPGGHLEPGQGFYRVTPMIEDLHIIDGNLNRRLRRNYARTMTNRIL